MSSKTTEIVQAAFDAISREDVQGFLALTHSDLVLVEPASMAVGGVHVGHEAVLKKVLLTMGKRLKVRVQSATLIGEGPTIAASLQVLFTSRRTGAELVMPYVELHTVRDGKIARMEIYPQDTQTLNAFWDAN